MGTDTISCSTLHTRSSNHFTPHTGTDTDHSSLNHYDIHNHFTPHTGTDTNNHRPILQHPILIISHPTRGRIPGALCALFTVLLIISHPTRGRIRSSVVNVSSPVLIISHPTRGRIHCTGNHSFTCHNNHFTPHTGTDTYTLSDFPRKQPNHFTPHTGTDTVIKNRRNK